MADTLKQARKSSVAGGHNKAINGHISNFKPGVRYFVLPNYQELDPPRAVPERPISVVERVRAELTRGPRTQRELSVLLGLDSYTAGGALYALKQSNELRWTERARRDGTVQWGRRVERVYALKDAEVLTP